MKNFIHLEPQNVVCVFFFFTFPQQQRRNRSDSTHDSCVCDTQTERKRVWMSHIINPQMDEGKRKWLNGWEERMWPGRGRGQWEPDKETEGSLSSSQSRGRPRGRKLAGWMCDSCGKLWMDGQHSSPIRKSGLQPHYILIIAHVHQTLVLRAHTQDVFHLLSSLGLLARAQSHSLRRRKKKEKKGLRREG